MSKTKSVVIAAIIVLVVVLFWGLLGSSCKHPVEKPVTPAVQEEVTPPATDQPALADSTAIGTT